MSRLAQKGEIYRIRNGIYYKPLRNKFLKGRIVPPNVDEALKVISKNITKRFNFMVVLRLINLD
ncbi:hypothetical protein Q5E79_020220 (plasmid) [Acinetobacter baumannii]